MTNLREEAIIKKIGGRFKLSTLIQKRLVQTQRRRRPLVERKNDNKMQIVINEIMQDKIYLDTEMNVQGGGRASSPARWRSTSAICKPLCHDAFAWHVPERRRAYIYGRQGMSALPDTTP